MKRSTILLIVIFAIIIAMPLIIIGLVSKDVIKIQDWIVENFNIDNNTPTYIYTLDITSPNAGSIPPCNIHINTYKGAVDAQNPVFFVAAAGGVETAMVGDNINVVLDGVKDLVDGDLCLTIEVPHNARLKIVNRVPNADVNIVGGSYDALYFDTWSDLQISDVNIGGIMSVDTTSYKTIAIDDSNIGAMELNGDKVDFKVEDSNVGVIAIAGTCSNINFHDSSIGMCSWNNACSVKAVVDDCIISTQVGEGIVAVTMDDFEKGTHSAIKIAPDTANAIVDITDGEDKVKISPTGVHVESEDGERVDISPTGVHVNDDDVTVNITPVGIVVKEDGKEIVNVGVGGVKVKK